MDNLIPELILDLTALGGHARKVIALNVFENLLRLGYTFKLDPNGIQYRKHLMASRIHIFVPKAASLTTIMVDYPPLYNRIFNEVKVFDATTQSGDFLLAAREALTLKTVINGVKVTITPTKIDLDATTALTSVMAKAKDLQKFRFGLIA